MVLARYRSDPDVKRTGNQWSNPLMCFTSIEVSASPLFSYNFDPMFNLIRLITVS